VSLSESSSRTIACLTGFEVFANNVLEVILD
jgi:hypothetical protein